MDKDFDSFKFLKELMEKNPLETPEEPCLIYQKQYLSNIEDIVNTIAPLDKIKYNKKYADDMLNAIKDNSVLNSLSEESSERIKDLFVHAVNIASLTSSLLEIYVCEQEQYSIVDISNSALGMFADEIFLLGGLMIQANEIIIHKHSKTDDLSTLSIFLDFEKNSLNVVNIIKKSLLNDTEKES